MTMTSSAPVLNPTLASLVEANEGRSPDLVRLKYQRMSADLFSFFRGSDNLFALAWPSLKPDDPGPAIVLCGDLHLENFGAFRSEDGDFLYGINDFDEALVGPCSLDLVRCATSILLASQVWGLSPIQAMRTVLGYLDHYRTTILGKPGADIADPLTEENQTGPFKALIGRCALGTQRHLLDAVTRTDKAGVRSIRRCHGKFPVLAKGKAAPVIAAVKAHGVTRGQADHYRVLDVAERVAGIGSLGVLRYLVLIEGDGGPDGNRLLDVKQARPSALAPCAEGPQPLCWFDEARRVVEAQKQLQGKSAVGLDAIKIEGTDFRFREMVPDENRATIDRFRRKPAKLRRAVVVAGRTTAWAQLRGAKVEGDDRTEALRQWAASPALEAVLAAAVRFAEQTRRDYKLFRRAKLEPVS